jgi:hypothetical protein
MSDLPKLATLVGLTMAFANLASATGEEPPPPPPVEGICHNIGGPRDLGANCDGTGTCTYTLDTGATITVAAGSFLGILIPPTSAGALAAHLAHGDGPVQTTYDPPLHLASTGQIHKASNVECVGTRVVPQPPEPGN